MNHYPIAFTDMPDWVQKCAREILGQNKRPNAYITALECAEIGGAWHDSQCLTLVARNEFGQLSTVRGTFGGINPFASAKQNLVNAGTKMAIPQSCAVLEISQGITEYVHLFINPHDAMPLLPVSNVLTDVQGAMLEMLDSHTSAGRKYELEHNSIPQWFYNDLIGELVSAGMVKQSANGAVTVTLKGKQTRNSWEFNKYSGFWYRWGQNWDYDTRTYKKYPTGYTAQVLKEYAQKYHSAA